MAPIREYYEKDFAFTTKMHIKFPFKEDFIEGIIHYDFNGYSAFIACYIN